jgi:ComEC/Rec2-related protein
VTPGRVPLFWVSIAFATGCLLGLDGAASWPIALALVVVVGLAWIFIRGERTSLALFYLFVITAALAHTLILAATVAPDDARRLPSDKALASTQWRGRVIEEPQTAPRRNRRALDRTSFTLQLDAWRPTGGELFGEDGDASWQTASGRVSCTVLGPAQDIRPGDEIEFAGALTPIAAPLIPGQLDLRAYDGQRDIYEEAMIRPLDWRRLSRTESSEPWWERLSFEARDWAYARLQWGIEDDPRIADFLAGMLIGYRQEIPLDIEQDFRVTGTLHVFAISGQNIAEMAVVAIILLQLCGLVRWRWAWLLAPIVLIYCLLAGSPASAVRATVMALAILLAWRLGRPLNALGCWSIAVLAMLTWDPRVLLDPGAQLSFGVVLGLILLSPPIYRAIAARFQHDPFLPAKLMTAGQKREELIWSRATALLAASIAATLASEPITALDFHQVTPISIVANLLVVPLAGLITIVGTISVTFSLLGYNLAALCNNANWLLARIMIAIVSYFAHEPGAAINVPDLRVAGQPAPIFVAAPLQDSACLLVKDGSQAWLLDTGREVSPPSPPARLLQFYGINRLDGLILAQPDTPDNGGAALIVRQFHPRWIVVPVLASRSPLEREIPQLARESGVTIERCARGSSLELGPGLRADVLGPALESTASREDDRALVLLFHSGNGTMLWAGRLDAAGQMELASAYPGLRVDVLLLGPEAAPSADWLQALGAKFWLQLPPRQRYLNGGALNAAGTASCAVWPLEQTGAVTVHFTDGDRSGVELTPWVAARETNCSGGL